MFVNVAGGVKVAEPSIDLAIALSDRVGHVNRPLPPGTLAVGELGLGGEVRTVPQLETRLREASRAAARRPRHHPPPRRPPPPSWAAASEVRRLSQAMADL